MEYNWVNNYMKNQKINDLKKDAISKLYQGIQELEEARGLSDFNKKNEIQMIINSIEHQIYLLEKQ